LLNDVLGISQFSVNVFTLDCHLYKTFHIVSGKGGCIANLQSKTANQGGKSA